MDMVDKNDSVLIIGGGTWGCSIALELARNGYSSVMVLDGEDVPSSIVAGNDLNKIMEEGIALNLKMIQTLHMRGIASMIYALQHGLMIRYINLIIITNIKKVVTADQFRNTMPLGVLTGDFKGWRGFAKPSGAGWVYARGAIIAAKQEAERLGVRFITGQHGLVTRLLYSDETEHGEREGMLKRRTLRGVISADGTIYRAHTTVLANGANADSLIDLKHQLRPTAWTLAHIQMTPSEAELYKDLPVLFNIEKGFFMEPSAETHELKICDEHPGYINPVYQELPPDNSLIREHADGKYKDGKNIVGSKPFTRRQIPLESEDRVRAFLKETMPHLETRPFSFARICWDADTVDRMPLIDWYTSDDGEDLSSRREAEGGVEGGRLLLAVGGSGHCFKTMPAIGQVILEFLEGRVDGKTRRAFRWRPGIAEGRNWWDVQGRWGAQGEVMDFNKVKGWTTIGET
ncbi:hypothetical protein E0Z10_g4494 [Xylaria hypoxylon]|uniref:FAD dependent oxidoreductase domain-containing protein n=1 Tax=Xylaria hypoxylon TaxID=37992 RepID=A0A4Z0YYJ3_9PEZI|nr:hypothetical protein E0Z10_g4494 [Xylaria hypoxylon]